MKHLHTFQRAISLVTTLALALSLCMIPAVATETKVEPAKGSIVNTSNDGGEHMISLSGPRTFKAMVPVSLPETEAKTVAKTVQWKLLPDATQFYLDATQFPNRTKGGLLADWLCADGTTPLFSNLVSGAETVQGQVYLTLTFQSACYFGDDLSVPHQNGGPYLDVCGYFNLTVLQGDKDLGSAPVKIVPYDGFHTMAEIYASMDELVAYAAKNTDLYVVKASMGKSQGDNGMESLDMPYLIVAKDKAAVEKWQSIKTEAEQDPTALLKKIQSKTLGEYQVPVLYSNVHANEVSASDGVLKFAWMLVEAAADTGKLNYDKLTGFTQAGKDELTKELGKAGTEGSIAVPDLVKDSATYLGYLHDDNVMDTEWGANIYSGPVDLKKYYTMTTEQVDTDELLDDVFFLLVPEENVEGRTYLTRTSSGGFDLNRDNSFQTQSETQNMTHFIASWNPVSFTEFHGRVEAFQCEPCDPPHEPNFEYDLLAENLMAGGEALGIAAVANNRGHNSYVIPQRDYLTYTGEKTANGADETKWLEPWDDMSTSYTPQYAMLHGTVSYTVEVPAYNDHTVNAVAYGQLGQANHIADNKESYLRNQTKVFERGTTNFNSNAYDLVGQWFSDQYDVEGAEATLFRPEYEAQGQNGNFYPECYIIPLDGTNQVNLQAANDMMEYLARNGVKVLLSDKAFSYGGITYPAGTMVVTMYQAKRSVANGMLYDGTVITEWPILYSEGITAFNKTRGFDMAVCAEPEAYKTIRAACGAFLDYEECQTYLSKVISSFSGTTGGKVIIRNASEDSTAAVNALLMAGKSVKLITDGTYKGSFLCDYSDYLTVSTQYVVTGLGIDGSAPAAQPIAKAPVLYISGKPADNVNGFVKTKLVSGAYPYNYDRQALELLGFQVTERAAEADLIIGAAAPDAAALAAIQSGTRYLGYGPQVATAITKLFPEGALGWNSVSDESMDALSYVTYPTKSLVTASYVAEGDDLLYGYGAAYFSALPKGAQILVQLDGSKAPLEGFLVSTGEHYKDFLNSSIQAISYQGKGVDGTDLDLILFANTLTNKVHQRDEFNFISNAAFSSVLGASFTDVDAQAWYADEVQESVVAGLMNGTSATTFAPTTAATRGMLLTSLHRMVGSPTAKGASFTDVPDWCTAAVNWAVESGVSLWTTGTTFDPNALLTREQAVTLIYRTAQSLGLDVTNTSPLTGYSDVNQVSDFATGAMGWAVKTGLVTGTSANTLTPATTTTRAEMAALLLRAQQIYASSQKAA